MRWAATTGGEVGRAVGMSVLAGCVERAVAVLVWATDGVMGRLVGVDSAVWGSWHARVARMSRIRMIKRGWLRGEIMQAIITLLGEHAVQDKKEAPTEKQQTENSSCQFHTPIPGGDQGTHNECRQAGK